MQIFRKLAKNIFFKIILAIVGLSFVLFGISGFIAGMPNSWVLKIGKERISANAFQKALDLDRKIIRSVRGSSPEIESYINSEKFKSDVANRLVRKILIQKISNEIGAFGSKKLILKSIAEDTNFQDQAGKFDQNKFAQFLKQNGLDEERYFQEVSNEVSGGMIIQTISMASPVNFKSAIELEEFNQEKRIADVFVVNKNNVINIPETTEEEITKFYNENKDKYKTKELREVSFIEVKQSDIITPASVSEEEIKKFYDANKSLFTVEENRDFYHIVLDEETKANDFIKKLEAGLNQDKSNIKDQFVKVAKEYKKTLKEIDIKKISRNALPNEIASKVNDLKINEISGVVKSKIGFHIFLLNSINPSQEIPLAEVKDKISTKLIAEKKEKNIQESITKLNDSLMSSKNLEEVANKFKTKISNIGVAISNDGLDANGKEVLAIKTLKDFAKNTFEAKEKQPSKVFATNENDKFYALEVNKIIPSRELDIKEARTAIVIEISNRKKLAELKKLATQIHEEIVKNPNQALAIASKNGLKIERGKTFPRTFYIDLGSSKMPYKNQFLDEIFATKLNNATKAVAMSQDEYMIGIVRDIKTPKLSGEELESAKKNSVGIFTNDILIEYNDYLQKKYPVEINEKFFGEKSS